jgi:hypothetical protein
MALEKVYPPTDVAVLRKSKQLESLFLNIAGKLGDNRPAMKIPNAKPKFEEHAHTFFAQRLQVLNKP